MRIRSIPRVMSSPFSTMAGKQPAASRGNLTLRNTNDTCNGKVAYHKIARAYGWILNLSSRGLTLWSYFRQRPPLIQLVPWCSWVFARVLYLLLPLLLLLSLAERSGAAHSQQLTAEIRHCVSAPPSHALMLPTDRPSAVICCAFANRWGRRHWITSKSFLDFTLICSCRDQWMLCVTKEQVAHLEERLKV